MEDSSVLEPTKILRATHCYEQSYSQIQLNLNTGNPKALAANLTAWIDPSLQQVKSSCVNTSPQIS